MVLQHLVAAGCLATATCGCVHTRAPRVVSSAELPVHGKDPLQHTTYLGSDDQFHHFSLQNGKSGGELVIRRDEAEIVPEAYPLDTGRHPFVESAQLGKINLMVLE